MARMTRKTRVRQNGKKLTAGRRGSVRFGGSDVSVIVIEDRGPVGQSGRRLVRVQFAESEGDPSSTFEIPADELVLTGQRG